MAEINILVGAELEKDSIYNIKKQIEGIKSTAKVGADMDGNVKSIIIKASDIFSVDISNRFCNSI